MFDYFTQLISITLFGPIISQFSSFPSTEALIMALLAITQFFKTTLSSTIALSQRMTFSNKTFFPILQLLPTTTA